MNFEKLALIRILRVKEIKLLMSLDQKLFLRGSHKVIFKALKAYLHKFGKIPSGSILAEAMRTQLSTGKAETYIGMLDGFELYDKELPEPDEIKKNLEEAYLINTIEQNLEKLVEASKEKDINTVKSLLSSLQTATTMGDKIPENILDMEYVPSKVRLVDSCFESMRENGLKLGGLCILGAGSGNGKSVWLLQQLMYSFKVDKISCCLLNLELSETDVLSRMYSQATNTKFSEVYGNDNPVQVIKINKWIKDYFDNGNTLFNMRNVRYSSEEIERVIRTQAQLGVTVFGIDYLALVENDENSEEWKALSKLVKLLHSLSVELGIVIFSPTQVNGANVKITDNNLDITTRGSKELIFSATVFCYIHQSPEEFSEGVCRVFTLKSRNSQRYTYIMQTAFDTMQFIDTGISTL